MSKRLQNVAFVGHMRSGKDSIAECLQALYATQGIVRLSFADALKQEVADALNTTRAVGEPKFDVAFFNNDANRPRFRPLLQWWGTEYRRAQDPDHWVRIVEQRIHALDSNFSLVCTDARFLNELDMLHRRGFKVVHLDMEVEQLYDYLRDQGLSREQISAQLDHPSEREWKVFPSDIRLASRFGNLPRLTAQVIAFLTGEAPDAATERKITEFYAQRYPKTYG